MRLGVIGTGHVGLVTCVSFAALGHEVVGSDEDAAKIAKINNGESPFYEPDLEELLGKYLAEGKLTFSTESAAAVADADAVFICVGTPPRASGEANLIAVERAVRQVARDATGPLVVAEKSTVPAGTYTRLRRVMAHERPDLEADFDIVSNPEFLREGSAIADSLNPDRILVGADSDDALETMRRVYEPLTRKGVLMIETNTATAEIAKHACNAFLALKISYANALARICERAGADVVSVADVMGSDPRIGRAFLDAGLGYGGYCFPKDLAAFERLAATLGYELPLLTQVAQINDEAVEVCLANVAEALWNLEDKRIALLGLSFKPGTDDTRFSPSLALAQKLLDAGAQVVGYDPHAMAPAKAEVPGIELAPTAMEALAGSHCLVLGTAWDEFKTLDLEAVRAAMAYPVVVDGRNMFDPAAMRDAGFAYYPVGRQPVTAERHERMPRA